jgi:hypothetical protein
MGRGKRIFGPALIFKKMQYKIIITFTILFLLLGNACLKEPLGGETMKITSPEFENNGFIPAKFTCEGKDINPKLEIKDIPKQAKSLALIVDDPDAPRGTWVHWVVFNIPLTAEIKENSVPGKLGTTNSGQIDFHGPCPPSGTHRYFFKAYALDAVLDLNEGIEKAELEKAMQGHILDKAELVGLFKR